MSPRGGERDTLAPGEVGASALGAREEGGVPPPARWQSLLAGAIRDVDELWRVLALPVADLPAARAAAQGFPLVVPRGFAAAMRPGDLHDPLLRQVLPVGAELVQVPGFVPDPLEESAAESIPGLLRKYQGRALLVTTGACAVHCRYCFRRHFPYQDLPRGQAWWQDALTTLAADSSISELILSGGDPLTLPDVQLAELASAAAAIPHLRRLRIHTRLPVVLPERVDRALTDWISRVRIRVVVVIHANHAHELTAAVREACGRLHQAGALLLNQSVLLRGVNDHLEALCALSHGLAEAGVIPYYLHALDPVAGAAHFAVPDEEGARLVEELASCLPGYLVPRLVREVPGARSKLPVRHSP